MQRDSFRGLDFPSSLLSPIPKHLPGGTCCAECDKPQAQWFLQPLRGLAPICSLCVLYLVPWEGKSLTDVETYIEAVEAEMDQVFVRDSRGRLCRCSDADRLVSALVLAGRVSRMVDRGKRCQ